MKSVRALNDLDFDNADDMAEVLRRVNIVHVKAVEHVDATGEWHGRIQCPVCEGVEALMYSRARFNGHVSAKCRNGCIEFIE